MGRNTFKTLLALFICVALIFQFPAIVEAKATPVPICTVTGDQYSPSISGRYIVWQDQRNHCDIRMYDLQENKESLVYQSSSFAYSPIIQGDRIIWVENIYNEEGTHSIQMHNITTGAKSTLLNLRVRSLNSLAFNGNIIAWSQEIESLRSNVFYYDMRTELVTQITQSGFAYGPDVYGDFIVWYEYRNYQRHDIYLYNIATGVERQITDDGELQTIPSVHGERIV